MPSLCCCDGTPHGQAGVRRMHSAELACTHFFPRCEGVRCAARTSSMRSFTSCGSSIRVSDVVPAVGIHHAMPDMTDLRRHCCEILSAPIAEKGAQSSILHRCRQIECNQACRWHIGSCTCWRLHCRSLRLCCGLHGGRCWCGAGDCVGIGISLAAGAAPTRPGGG